MPESVVRRPRQLQAVSFRRCV